MAIHLGKTRSREGWVSFETDSHLSRTKKRLFARCLPCLTGLLEQLKAGAQRIELREAWTCWKVTIVTADEGECFRVLECFGAKYPDEPVLGKIGGGVGRRTCAVVFHTESRERADELATMLTGLAAEHFPEKKVFASRACGNPYEVLLGPWQEWTPAAPIRYPERVPEVKESLVRSLYRQGD